MTLGNIIKKYRIDHQLSQRQFALQCRVSNGYISMLEEGRNPKTKEPIVPSIATMQKLATAMGMSLNDLMAETSDMKVSLFDRRLTEDSMEVPLIPSVARPVTTMRLPVLGNVACGEPIFANEEHEAYVEVDNKIKADFCLTAKGDSMINARIFDGDLLLVRQQDIVDDGEIAVVLVEDEATVKRVYYDRENNILTLVPENPTYKPMRFIGEQLNQIRIIGKVLAGQYTIL